MTSLPTSSCLLSLYLLLGLTLIFSGLKLKGCLQKQKLKLFLNRFLPLFMILGLSFLIMKQAEKFRYQFESCWNVSYLLLNPFLKLGLFLQKCLPPFLQLIVRKILSTEVWIIAHQKLAILFLLFGISVLFVLFLLLKRRKNPLPVIIFLLSLFLGVIGIIFSKLNNIPLSIKFGGSAAICIIIYALFTRKKPHGPPISNKISIFLLCIILLLSLCLRTYQLYTVSARCDSWETVYGREALKVLSGSHPVYLWSKTWWHGLGHYTHLSPIYIYFMAFFFRIFGSNLVALRLVPAVCGVLTVYFTYSLFKLLFNNTLALIVAALFAFSPLHISFSRVSHFASISLMTGVLILLLLFRAIKYNRYLPYLFLGIIFSFMGYLYSPMMIFFPLACFFILIYIFFQKGFLRRNWIGIVFMVLAIYLVIGLFHIPVWERMFPKLFVYESVWHRTSEHRFTSQANYIRGIPLVQENIQKLFWSFVRDGEFNYNIWPKGNLYFNPLLTVFLFWGLIYSLLNLEKANFRIVVFLGAVFFLPNILSRPPVIVRRLLFMFPFLYFFSALPLYRFWEESTKLFSVWGKRIALVLILAVIVMVGSYNSTIYFYSREPAGRWEKERFFDEYVKKHIGDYYAYILPLRENSKITIDFLLWEKVQTGRPKDYYQYISKEKINRLNPNDIPIDKPVAFFCVANQVRRQDLEKLKRRLGEGRLEEYRDKFSRLVAYALFVE